MEKKQLVFNTFFYHKQKLFNLIGLNTIPDHAPPPHNPPQQTVDIHLIYSIAVE